MLWNVSSCCLWLGNTFSADMSRRQIKHQVLLCVCTRHCQGILWECTAHIMSGCTVACHDVCTLMTHTYRWGTNTFSQVCYLFCVRACNMLIPWLGLNQPLGFIAYSGPQREWSAGVFSSCYTLTHSMHPNYIKSFLMVLSPVPVTLQLHVKSGKSLIKETVWNNYQEQVEAPHWIN